MNKSKFVKFGGILIVLLALAALVGSSLTFAQDEEPDSDDTVTIPEDGSETEEGGEADDATSGRGRFAQRGRGLRGSIDREAARELLADELGVTVEDMEAAYDAVKEAVQAEDGRPDRDEVKALLAEELSVTVEELDAAQDAVQDAMLAQLVEDGTITQEELDEMLAMQELRQLGKEIFSRDDAKAVIAEQLGLTVEALAAANEDGARIAELAEEQGLAMETLQTAVSDARTAAIETAVADGTITQAQADILLSHEGPGPGGPGNCGPGGRSGHGPGGHGDPGGPRGGGSGPGNFDGPNGNGDGNSSDLGA